MGPKRMAEVFAASKPKSEEVPVVACRGWFDACEFCDKRFCEWAPVDEDLWLRIPRRPGALMVALSSKGVTEVVNLSMEESDVQKAAAELVDKLREQISNKKAKVTKATLLVRWMNFKKVDDKDVMTLCAHWFNNGVVPKFQTQFPGTEKLQESSYFVFSKNIQKWCHPKKDPVWRKAKAPSRKIVEIVKKCDWFGPCEICDAFFGKWKTLSSVFANDSAPDENGIVMVSVVYEKKREVVYFFLNMCSPESVTVNLKNSFSKNNRYFFNSLVRNEKFVSKNPSVEVRWSTLKDATSSDSCLLFAHWLNVGKVPMLNRWALGNRVPGEHILERNKSFANRGTDKKWYMITDAWKALKISKVKDKKALLDSIEDDCLDLESK